MGSFTTFRVCSTKKWLMNAYKKYGTTAFLALALIIQANGQEAPVHEKVPGFSRFVSYTTHLDSLIFSRVQRESPQIDIVSLNGRTVFAADSVFENRFSSLKKETKSATGLDLNGSYNYKIGSQTNDDEIDIYSPYTNRFQLGVNWDIISSGLYKQNKKIKLAELENEQLKCNYLYALKGQTIEETRQNIIDFHSRQIYQLQTIRFGLYDFLKNLVDKPASEEGMTLYLDIHDQWAAIRNELNSYDQKGYDKASSELFNILKDTPMLDSAQFLQQVVNGNKDLIGSNHDLAILNAKKNLISYPDGMKVTPFVRGQHYIRPGKNSSNSNNSPSTSADIGVSLSVPLSVESKYKKKNLGAEQNVAEINLLQITASTLFKAHQILDKQNLLLLSLQQELIRLNILKHNILNNQLMIKYNNDYFSAPKIIFAYDNYFKELIRLYQVKQDYMTLLADASDLAGGADLAQITVRKDIAYRNPESGPAIRETLLIRPNNSDPLILSNIMWRNQLDACLIVDPGKSAAQYDDLVQKLSLYDIETTLLIDARQVLSKTGNDLTEALNRQYIIPVGTVYFDLTRQNGHTSTDRFQVGMQAALDWGAAKRINVRFIIPFRDTDKVLALFPGTPAFDWVLKIEPSEEAALRNRLETDKPQFTSVGIQVDTDSSKWHSSSESSPIGRILTDGENYLKSQYPLSVGYRNEEETGTYK